ncbi:hypothetical protein ACF08N_01610 [Streptomyces sp. NPDC015127]|uniref:hypothetical protein n=1 Tax=Streptomyces sp. NPDC015127 TaxID=3364939 RepID=UPI0036FC3ADA
MTVHDVAAALPDIATLRRLCRAVAVAEAVLNPGDYRTYTFDADWSETEEVFSMRNGGGDEFDVVFSPAGAYIRGFDHESPMSPYDDDLPWPGVVDSVPEVFRSCVEEPAFSDGDMPLVTACLWREAGDDRWRTGRIEFPEGAADPDGSGYLFELLVDPTPEAFQSFAEDYYERPVDIKAVHHIYEGRPLTEDVVARLNPRASFADIVAEAAGTGYPVR